MAKTRAIVKRRKAIRNIRKITRTMELIATARFKKAFDRATEAEAFTRKIAELAADLSASATDVKHPLLVKREEVKNTLLLVASSNRGLCGGYNASIIREAGRRIEDIKKSGETLHLELSGKRAIANFRYQGIPAEAAYTHFEDKPSFEEVDVLANRYIADYVAGKIDRVEVAYMKFQNASRQAPVVETLLPLSALAPSVSADPIGSDPQFVVTFKTGGEFSSLIGHCTGSAVKTGDLFRKAYSPQIGDFDVNIRVDEIKVKDRVVQGLEPKVDGSLFISGTGIAKIGGGTILKLGRKSWQPPPPVVDYEFLPSAADILEEILPMSFKIRLFKSFLDAAVSEQIARRVAMKAATENAADMIKLLTRQYNRARQAQITKEIAEVIGGAEALK